MDIMCDAALLAASPLQEIGSILVATRDSDFRLVSRALQEKYGFGVVSDAQQLNSRVRYNSSLTCERLAPLQKQEHERRVASSINRSKS